MTEQENAAINQWTQDIHRGDAVETLAEMPESSVHCVMTSPPYFGLRDYGVDGQIGLEESLGEYIDSLLDVASELRRVLRPDGSWWLNLGDSFAGSWGAQSKDDEANHRDRDAYPGKNPARNGTLRRKSKMLVPHRVAIALEDVGWIVRADAVWAKPNPMPHPVKDRFHEHKEFVFHLTPEPDYWFDLDAIREPHKERSLERAKRYDFRASVEGHPGDIYPDRPDGSEPHNFDTAVHPNGKNPGDALEIPVQAFPEAHFAVYPPELCEAPVKASCPPEVCAECGKPYGRETETEYVNPGNRTTNGPKYTDRGHESPNSDKRLEARHYPGPWKQSCDCDTDETEPGIVLDPFAGAGTTCLVAKELGRRFVGIDLNPEYVAMAQKRVGVTVDEPGLLLEDGETPLTAYTDGGGAE